MKPSTMSEVLALAVDEAVDDDEAPLMLELHAVSSPPPPTTAAPAPAARSMLRRLRPSPELVPLGCAVWSVIVLSISFKAAPSARTASDKAISVCWCRRCRKAP
jgi:hypothetical protein